MREVANFRIGKEAGKFLKVLLEIYSLEFSTPME